MTSQNCFPGFCAVGKIFFQMFLFPLDFDRCVMCNLNSQSDLTLKLLNLDLLYKGGPRFCAMNLSKFKISSLSSYLRYWRDFFSFQLPLNISIKNGIKIWSWRMSANVTRKLKLSLWTTVVHAVSTLKLMFSWGHKGNNSKPCSWLWLTVP